MKSFLLGVILVLSSFLSAQTYNEICLTGKVIDINNKPIYKGIAVGLKINDTILVISPISSDGSYTLYTDRRTLTNYQCKLYAYQQTRIKKKNLPKECWNAYEYEDEFLTVTLIKLVAPFQDTITNVLRMTKLLRCGWDLPSINFQKNSLEYLKIQRTMSGDSVIMALKCAIIENNFVIEISAHADLGEKSPDKLSAKRAEKIKMELIKLGVPEQMLVAKGYGSKRLLITKREISKTRSKNEKNILRQKNRRVVFSVLRKNSIGDTQSGMDDND